MTWSGLLQELLGSLMGGTNASREANAKGVFEFPRWYLALKTVCVTAVGLFLLWFGAVSKFGLSRFERALVLLVAIGVIAIGMSVAKGPRRFVVETGTVRAEYSNGRIQSWRLRDLAADRPTRFARMSVAVRELSTGSVAFVIPRDLPGWEVLVNSIGVGGAA